MSTLVPSTRRDRRAFVAALMAAGLVVWSLPRASSEPPGDEPTRGSSSETRDVSEPYPERHRAIRFSHEAHAETPCRTCHGDATSSRTSSDELRPNMAVCAECHRSDASPELANCSGCHVGYDVDVDETIDAPEDWRAVRPAPMIPASPDPALRFDHRRHLEALEAEGEAACRSCHGVEDGRAADMPSMESCMECHGSKNGDEATSSPSGACETCHPGATSNGEPASEEDSASLVGPEALSTEQLWEDVGDPESESAMEPPSHDADWLQRHGTASRARSHTCEDCHTEQDCNSCHDDAMARPSSVHPPNYDVLHASDARTRRDDCTDCHTVETFCTQCHDRAEVVPRSRDEPIRTRGDFHPSNWVQSGGGGHAIEARQRITDCASCHTEQDCVSCHQGVNPHPPEFRLKCRRLLEANPRTCLECHGNRRRLEGMCR